MFDGDTIFTCSTGKVKADVSLVGMLAAKSIARSIANAIYCSDASYGLISYKEISK